MKLKQFNFKKVKSTNQTAIGLIKSSKSEFGLIVSDAQSTKIIRPKVRPN